MKSERMSRHDILMRLLDLKQRGLWNVVSLRGDALGVWFKREAWMEETHVSWDKAQSIIESARKAATH